MTDEAAERAENTGPPLARYEAALARVALARASGDADAAELGRLALALFDRGGVRQGRDRLTGDYPRAG